MFSAGLTLLMLVFIATGGLTAQLFATRRRASGAGGLVLGALFLLRMVADGSSGLGWLRWLTPFGWLEELRPFADNRVLPLLLLAGLAVAVGAIAIALSRQRDLGDGIVRERDTAEMQAGLLRAPFPFQWRQGTGALIGWGVSLVAAGLVIGGITSAFTQYVAENPEVEKFVGKFGFGDLGSVAGFVGSMEVFPALAVALFAVAATNRTWEDEQERRLELALPNPVTRPRWLGASVLATSIAVLLVSAGCAVATWLAVKAANGDLGLGQALAGILNTLAGGGGLPRDRGAASRPASRGDAARCGRLCRRRAVRQRVRPDDQAPVLGPRPVAFPPPRERARDAGRLDDDDRVARARSHASRRRLRRLLAARPAGLGLH